MLRNRPKFFRQQSQKRFGVFFSKQTFFFKCSFSTKIAVFPKLPKIPTESPELCSLNSDFSYGILLSFKTSFPSINSSSTLTAVLTRLPNSFRQRPERFRSSLKTFWNYKNFFSQQLFLHEMILWHLGRSFGNLAHKDSRKLKTNCSENKKDHKIW